MTVEIPGMKRRTFTALGGAVLLAGCIGGGDGALFDRTVEAGEETYPSFGASEGEELRITISAGEDGANTGVSATQLNGIDEGVNWWGWELDADEEVTDTIEIVMDDEYTVWINEGQADVTVENA
jgi:hypothetical protein